jgi:DNA topoisomerase IB
MNRNKFASISTNNSINLTYQEKPKIFNNYYAIKNSKQLGSTFRYKRKYKKYLNSHHEKLMPVLLTERKERTNN